MRRAAPIAWGLPLIPIAVLLGYDHSLYIGEESALCWMRLSAFYPAVLSPIVVIMLANIAIFIVIITKVVIVSKNGLRSNQSTKIRTWYQFRMALCLFFLLGFAWAFRFLAFGEAQIVFEFIFCIFAPLQGFFIFVFFILRERTVRLYWVEFAGNSNSTTTTRLLQNNSSDSNKPSKTKGTPKLISNVPLDT